MREQQHSHGNGGTVTSGELKVNLADVMKRRYILRHLGNIYTCLGTSSTGTQKWHPEIHDDNSWVEFLICGRVN